MHKALCEYSKERPHVLKNNSSNDFEKKNNNRLIFQENMIFNFSELLIYDMNGIKVLCKVFF